MFPRFMEKHHQVVLCSFNTKFLSIVMRALSIVIPFKLNTYDKNTHLIAVTSF